MARGSVFFSKRLLRFAVMISVIVFVVFSLSSQNNVKESLVEYSNYVGYNSDTDPNSSRKGIDTADKIKILQTVASAANVIANSQAKKMAEEDAAMESAIVESLDDNDNNKDKDNKESNEKSTQDLIHGNKDDTKGVAGSDSSSSASNIADTLSDPSDTMGMFTKSFANKGNRPKACFVTLVRNSELHGIVSSIRMVEKRFNAQFKYDWIFLNDEPFTEEFKKTITNEVSSTVKFGLIPKEHWGYPEYIDENKAAQTRVDMADIIYGSSESYRHMCRYQSGFFWRHPLLDEYDWYWRVEPDIRIYCDIKYDVFQWMQDNEKVYGFTITIHEFEATIKTFWKTAMSFFKKNPDFVAKDNLMKFISNDNGKTYNLCHFWSNFEIANLNLWRSPAYKAYFDYLDRSGGFFYERWGDAPVHSIAAALMLPKDSVHYFSDIGYYHGPYDNCPLDPVLHKENNCDCDQANDFTFQGYSCGLEYYDAAGLKKPDNWKDYRD